MTLEDLGKLLDGAGVPVAYGHFKDSHAYPYIVYAETYSDNFTADDTNYSKFKEIQVDLYTSTKDTALQSKLETILTENDLFFESTETYVDTEKCTAVSYTFEIMED